MKDIRGQVIYGLVEILKQKKVKFFVFENVKGLVSHDNGATLSQIINLLNNAGYAVWYKVLNSNNFGVPHSRERVYLVGCLQDFAQWFDYEFPQSSDLHNLSDYLVDQDIQYSYDYKSNETFARYLSNRYNKGKYQIDKLLEQDLLVLDTRQSDLRLYKNTVPTLRKGRHGILYVKNGELRRLSGYEALLLQGFSKELAITCKEHIADTHLLNQAGNAMTATVISAIADKFFKYINH